MPDEAETGALDWTLTPKSTLSRFAYDKRKKVLTVEYRSSGYQYNFFDVPVEVFEQMKTTEFPGKIVLEIRLKYRWARV